MCRHVVREGPDHSREVICRATLLTEEGCCSVFEEEHLQTVGPTLQLILLHCDRVLFHRFTASYGEALLSYFGVFQL